MKKALLIVILLTLTACTKAGPYVTNISYDGKCTLYIEKGYTELNGVTGTIGNTDTTTTQINICK